MGIDDPVQRKYIFDWSLIGDLQVGRPHLGSSTRLENYRLFQFTMRDALEERFGTQTADEIFYAAGRKGGAAFYERYLSGCTTLEEFTRRFSGAMLEMNIGILRMEQSDLEQGVFVLTISEDLECSGMPITDYETCVYDEGFVAAILEQFTGRPFRAKEIDCWATGDRTCRFRVTAED